MNYIASIFSTIATVKRLTNKNFSIDGGGALSNVRQAPRRLPHSLPVGEAVSHIFTSSAAQDAGRLHFYGEQAVANLRKAAPTGGVVRKRRRLNHA